MVVLIWENSSRMIWHMYCRSVAVEISYEFDFCENDDFGRNNDDFGRNGVAVGLSLTVF